MYYCHTSSTKLSLRLAVGERVLNLLAAAPTKLFTRCPNTAPNRLLVSLFRTLIHSYRFISIHTNSYLHRMSPSNEHHEYCRYQYGPMPWWVLKWEYYCRYGYARRYIWVITFVVAWKISSARTQTHHLGCTPVPAFLIMKTTTSTRTKKKNKYYYSFYSSLVSSFVFIC